MRPASMWTAVLVVVTLALAGCAAAAPEGGSTAPASTRGPATPPALPATEDLDALGAVATTAYQDPDWMVDSRQGMWVANVEPGLVRYDDRGRRTASVRTGPIGVALETGFGALWAVDQDDDGGAGLVRVALDDPGSVRRVAVDGVPTPESSVAIADGRVWFLADRAGDRDLVAVDPTTMRVRTVRTFTPEEDAGALRGGFGSLWLTSTAGNRVLRLEPAKGSTIATVPVGSAPRFVAIGEDAVWVMNQQDGSVSLIDPDRDAVVATVVASEGPIDGGDIVATTSGVWVRSTAELATLIDSSSSTVVRRLGPAAGSGSIAVHGKDLWISAHDVTTVWRVPGAAARR